MFAPRLDADVHPKPRLRERVSTHVGTRRTGRPASRELTQRQYDVLAVIVALIAAHGFPPSFREIGDATGVVGTYGVGQVLKQLEEKGFISRTKGSGRSLRVLRSMQAADASRARVRGFESAQRASLVTLIAQRGEIYAAELARELQCTRFRAHDLLRALEAAGEATSVLIKRAGHREQVRIYRLRGAP